MNPITLIENLCRIFRYDRIFMLNIFYRIFISKHKEVFEYWDMGWYDTIFTVLQEEPRFTVFEIFTVDLRL